MSEKEATDNEASERLNLRLTKEEASRFEKVREAIQRRIGANIKATKKGAFLEALGMIEAYYDKLERDRQRSR